MPITLKQSLISYKDNNGEYHGINTIGEATTAEQVASIQATGAQQVTLVQAAGQAARDSVPQEYTALSDSVSDLKSAINSVAGYYSDEESITLNTGAIMVTSSTGTVASLTPDTTQTSYKYALVECKYLDKAIITGQGGSIRLYAFIDSNNVILAAATANQVNRDLELIAPQNTAYLIYNSKLGDMSKVDYYEYNSGSITDLQNDIDELKIEENSIWE